MFMKLTLIGLLLAGSVSFLAGCATPAYSGGLPTARIPQERSSGENANNMLRGMYNDSRMMADDFNAVFMISPGSNLTPWNMR